MQTVLHPTQDHLSTQLNQTSPHGPSATQQLKRLGLSETSIQQLTKQLHAEGDALYHAGRLLNGKTYVVTAQDKVFYGWPNALQPLNILHSTRNRCIDQQIRNYTADNGLNLRIETRDNHRSAQIQISLLGKLKLPVAHLRQIPFINGTP